MSKKSQNPHGEAVADALRELAGDALAIEVEQSAPGVRCTLAPHIDDDGLPLLPPHVMCVISTPRHADVGSQLVEELRRVADEHLALAAKVEAAMGREVTKLSPLMVLVENALGSHIVRLPDQRQSFCDEINAMSAQTGITARVVANDLASV